MGTIGYKQLKPLSSHSHTSHFLFHSAPHSQPWKDQVVSHFSQSEHPLTAKNQPTQFINSIQPNKESKKTTQNTQNFNLHR